MSIPLLIAACWSVFVYIPVVAAGCWRTSNCAYGPTGPTFSGSWDKYNYSPTSRNISPATIFSTTFQQIGTFPPSSPSVLSGNGSTLIFDFGKEVAGIITVTYSAQGAGQLGLAFSESKNWAGQWSDHSSNYNAPDGAIYGTISATSSGTYTMPDAKLRGGFRYLTLFTTTSSSISLTIQNISLEISYAPTWSNLRAYGGYFSSSSDLLNRIWYQGAYTLQTTSIPATTGREYPVVNQGWMNDANLHPNAIDPTVYVDGAKRDRMIWSGDMGVSVRSILVSTGDWNGIRYSLDTLYNIQASNGGLPFAGPAGNFFSSDTYHMAVMIGTYDYLLWTNDQAWLTAVWPKYHAAMNFIITKMDDPNNASGQLGFLYVTGDNDWGRITQGGHNTEANMLLYRVFITGAKIAAWAGDTASSTGWNLFAANLQTLIHNNLWDANAGAYVDSDTNRGMHPEDANAMALAYGVSGTAATQYISTYLTTLWGTYGSSCPELPGNVVPFVESIEVAGHFVAQQPQRALDLITRSWGWYLNNPLGTQSTMVEGYLTDGTFGYRGTSPGGYEGDTSFVSHSHGWSTGPTWALTNYVVGLSVTAPGGSQWVVAPQFGDLTSAEGGFTTPMGAFSAGWTMSGSTVSIWQVTPPGTTGTITPPAGWGSAAAKRSAEMASVQVNGDGTKHEVVFNKL